MPGALLGIALKPFYTSMRCKNRVTAGTYHSFKKESMKNLFMIFALLVATECGAQVATNLSFRFPIRVVDSQRVDLRYLFAHWHRGTDAVTNSRWVLLTGSIVEDTPSGWVVDGKTESASGLSFHQKVFVANPPRAEKQKLETLLGEQKDLTKQNAALKAEAASLEKASPPSNSSRRYRVRPQNISAAAKSQMETNVLQQESGVKGDLGELDKELAAIPTTHSSTGAVYRVDFFVFYTGQSWNGMPLLDFGIPSR